MAGIIGVGREEKLFVVPESTFGAAASAPAAGDAIRFLELNFQNAEERVFRADKRSTRSYLATIQKRLKVDWSLNGYLLPSGAAGTSPDGWDAIFKAAFGTETITGGTSVAYTLLKENTRSLTLHRGIGATAATAVAGEMVRGGVVNQLQLSFSGSDPAMVSASGFGADILRAGACTLSGDTGTVVTMTTAGNGNLFDVGQYVDIDVITDQLISSNTSNSITVPSHTAQTNGDPVMPSACIKAQTFASGAAPISGVYGSVTLESTSFSVVSGQITMNNGAKPHNDVYGSNKVTQFSMGNREVSGQLTYRLQDDTFIRLCNSRRRSTIALSLQLGSSAGSICTISCPNIIVDLSSLPSTPVEDILVTLPFKAYGSTGEDEISMTFT